MMISLRLSEQEKLRLAIKLKVMQHYEQDELHTLCIWSALSLSLSLFLSLSPSLAILNKSLNVLHVMGWKICIFVG